MGSKSECANDTYLGDLCVKTNASHLTYHGDSGGPLIAQVGYLDFFGKIMHFYERS